MDSCRASCRRDHGAHRGERWASHPAPLRRQFSAGCGLAAAVTAISLPAFLRWPEEREKRRTAFVPGGWTAPAVAAGCGVDAFCLQSSPLCCRRASAKINQYSRNLWSALVFWVTSLSPGGQRDAEGCCSCITPPRSDFDLPVAVQPHTSFPAWVAASPFPNNIFLSSGIFQDMGKLGPLETHGDYIRCLSWPLNVPPAFFCLQISCILVERSGSTAIKTGCLLPCLLWWPLHGKEVQPLGASWHAHRQCSMCIRWTTIIRSHVLPSLVILRHTIKENPDVVMLSVLFSIPEIANYMK